jgi:hypothetical protein
MSLGWGFVKIPRDMQQGTSQYPSKLPIYRHRQTDRQKDGVLEREKIFLEHTFLEF